MSHQRRTVHELLQKFKGSAGQKFLNEQVRLRKEHEAKSINNAGPRRQLEYLLEKLHAQKLESLCASFQREQQLLKELAERLQNRRRLANLVRCLYHQKACEAEKLAMNTVTEQLKYLLRLTGSISRLEAVLNQM